MFDLGIDTTELRLWIAAGSAALLFAVCVVAFVRPRRRTASLLGRISAIVLCAVLGGSLTWAYFGTMPAAAPGFGFAAERRALDRRAQELTLRSLEPGSPFACLDGLAGESVEAACQKALFAAPATVAAVTAYVTARFNLLSDMVAYVGRGGSGLDGTLSPMRRSLETDRFGFLAHALSVRDGCTSEDCKALDVLRDPSRVRANLGAETFDRILEPYLISWAQPAEAPVADANPALPPASVLTNARGPRKSAVNIDFPSAASIPAVSIMNTEPNSRPQPNGSATANAKQPAASPPQARARKQTANSGPQAAPPPDEPVWLPSAAAPAPAPQAATAAPPAATVRTQ